MSEDKYVALDVHKATTSLAVRDADGQIVEEGVIQTAGDLIIARVCSIPGRLHVTFEEGLHAAWLYDLLAPRVHRVLVCNPRTNALLASGSKSDRIDVRKLSKQLRAGELEAVYHGTDSYRALQQLVAVYETLVKDCTRTRARLKMLFVGRAIRCSGRSLFASSRREAWIAKLTEAGAQLRARLLFAELDTQIELRKRAKAAMVAESRRHQKAIRSIASVPGFGPVRTAQLLATVQTPHRFVSRRAFRTYVGLSVVTRSSADYELGPEGLRRRVQRSATRGLTRDFNRRLKNVFKGAALSASRRGPLASYYQALLTSGRKPEIAKVILARRLAMAVLSIWKRGELFDEARFLGLGEAATAARP